MVVVIFVSLLLKYLRVKDIQNEMQIIFFGKMVSGMTDSHVLLDFSHWFYFNSTLCEWRGWLQCKSFPFHICILLCDVWNIFPWIYWWYFSLRIWARRRCSQEVSWWCWELFYLEITCCINISKPHVLDQQKSWLQAKENKISKFCWNCNKHRTWASQGQTFHRRAENASFPGCLYQWVRAARSAHGSQGTEVSTHFDFSFPPRATGRCCSRVFALLILLFI